MNSRMDKYVNSSQESMSRTNRNKDIYNSTDMTKLSRIKTNDNVSIISDAHKEIDLEKIRKYVTMMNKEEEERKQRITLELPKEEEHIVKQKKEKIYDINSILENAKDKREVDYEENRHRKFDNTQIDLLKKITNKEEQSMDGHIVNEETSFDELNTEEKTIVNLIKNLKTNSEPDNSNEKDIFEDLMGENEETIVKPLEELNNEKLKEELLNITQDLESIKALGNDFTREINIEKSKIKNLEQQTDEETNIESEEIDFSELENDEEEYEIEETEEDEEETEKLGKADKSFYTNSMTFNKSDFEGFEDLEKSTRKSNLLTTISIIFVILLLLASIFLALNYLLDWNII